MHDIQEFPVADEPEEQESDSGNGLGNRINRSLSTKDEDSDSSSSSRGTLPDGVRNVSVNSRGFTTPRLEMFLDNRGGNWVDLRYEPRSLDSDTEEQRFENSEERRQERREEEFALLGDEREAADEADEELPDVDVHERDRRRTVNYGLNVLLQRNTLALREQLQALTADIEGNDNNNNNSNNDERQRRRGRGRAQAGGEEDGNDRRGAYYSS